MALLNEWVVVVVGCVWSAACFPLGFLVRTSDAAFPWVFAAAVTLTAVFAWRGLYNGAVPDFEIAADRTSFLQKLASAELAALAVGAFLLYGIGWEDVLTSYLLFAATGFVAIFLVEGNHFARLCREPASDERN